jgi:hypothetical protein
VLIVGTIRSVQSSPRLMKFCFSAADLNEIIFPAKASNPRTSRSSALYSMLMILGCMKNSLGVGVRVGVRVGGVVGQRIR